MVETRAELITKTHQNRWSAQWVFPVSVSPSIPSRGDRLQGSSVLFWLINAKSKRLHSNTYLQLLHWHLDWVKMLSILAFIESENINGFLVLNLIIRLNLDFTISQQQKKFFITTPISYISISRQCFTGKI